MALECFGSGPTLAGVMTSEEERKRAREVAATHLLSVGCASAEVVEILDMLGLLPESKEGARDAGSD